MSKFELQQRALEGSGVSFEESQVAIQLQPSLYERLGKETGWKQLSTLFYNRVFADTESPHFTSIFASSTKQEAIENQYLFFVQTFGGPDLYRQKKGKYTRLVGRHANYPIGKTAADRWVYHMIAAMKEHDCFQNDKDEEARLALEKYFQYTAHYIVAAMDYMRDDQLSGGTSADAGRNW